MLILAGCNNNSTGTSTLVAIKQRGKLIVGVKYDTNLFGLKDPATGEVNGFDVDIAKALARKIFGDANKVELKSVVSKTRIPMLQQGDIDAIIATMTITPERSKQVLFTDPYFDAGQSLLVKKGSPIKSIKDIKSGVRVISVKGSTSAKRIHDMAPDATLLQFDNYQNAFMALKSGKGEVLSTDNVILLGMSKDDPNYTVVGSNFSDEPYGIAVRKGDVEFANYINVFLKEIKSDGTYDAIYKKWLGSAPPKE
jgi:putative glutamine transport system substrate-binding protein